MSNWKESPYFAQSLKTEVEALVQVPQEGVILVARNIISENPDRFVAAFTEQHNQPLNVATFFLSKNRPFVLVLSAQELLDYRRDLLRLYELPLINNESARYSLELTCGPKAEWDSIKNNIQMENFAEEGEDMSYLIRKPSDVFGERVYLYDRIGENNIDAVTTLDLLTNANQFTRPNHASFAQTRIPLDQYLQMNK